MFGSVKLKEFAAGLEKVSVLTKGSFSMPILACVKIDCFKDGGLRLTTTDLSLTAVVNVGADATTPFPEDSSVLAPAKFLSAVVGTYASWKDDDELLHVETNDNGMLVIEYGRSVSRFRTMPLKDYPVVSMKTFDAVRHMTGAELVDLKNRYGSVADDKIPWVAASVVSMSENRSASNGYVLTIAPDGGEKIVLPTELVSLACSVFKPDEQVVISVGADVENAVYDRIVVEGASGFVSVVRQHVSVTDASSFLTKKPDIEFVNVQVADLRRAAKAVRTGAPAAKTVFAIDIGADGANTIRFSAKSEEYEGSSSSADVQAEQIFPTEPYVGRGTMTLGYFEQMLRSTLAETVRMSFSLGSTKLPQTIWFDEPDGARHVAMMLKQK